MKSMGDMLLTKTPFAEIVMGNTALVRAMIESGTCVVTSYPGSPTPEIATAIQSIPKEKRPFYFEFSTNEKVATEVAYGAAVNGHLSTVFFKSVGLNVASDTFVQLALMKLIGGMVIVLGDDPGANSSQNEQDNRHLARMSYTPVLEPSDPSEVYAFYKVAVALSKEQMMPVLLRLTTHVCHAKEKVFFGGWAPEPIDPTPRFDATHENYIPIAAPLVFPAKRRALERLNGLVFHDKLLSLTKVVDHGNKQKGIITAGLPFLSLMDVLDAAAGEKPDVLKLGAVYPLPKTVILNFLQTHNDVKILEELDDVFEKEIKAIAFDKGLKTTISGKLDMEDWIGEYTPDKVADILRKTWPALLTKKRDLPQDLPPVPWRPPQMCPGCGHRSAFFAIKQALQDTDITVADIGCHTLGFLPPYEVGKLLMCMGASTAIGSGLRLYNSSRNVVVFLGDSTFFHAGLPGILNAVFNKHAITLIVMENGTTAMTGHQDHAASGKNFNEPTEKIPIRQVLEGLGVEHIEEVDTYEQAKLKALVEKSVAIDDFSVVIARHPCMLKFTRERRKKPGYALYQVDIDQDRCTQHFTCVERFGCPTFTRASDGKIAVNQDLCIGDGSCRQTCPAAAISAPNKA